MLFRFSFDKDGKPTKKATIYTANETGIQVGKVDSDALYIIKKLKNSKYNAYIVGGAVRDLLIGHTPKDFDIVTSATPAKIKRLFHNSRIIGRRFRLVHVFFGKKIFEVSTFRSCKNGSIGNDFGTIEEDVLRRDFSINALYFDPLKNQVIDYVGGVEDLKKNVLTPIISQDIIFQEDPVRMIRAVKYSVLAGCAMNITLKRKIKKCAPLLATVSHSRLTEELTKIINSCSSCNIVEELVRLELYAYLQPAANAMMKTNQDFSSSYFEDLQRLDDTTRQNPLLDFGEKLESFIFSFVKTMTVKTMTKDANKTNTKSELAQLILDTYSRCHDFLQPMNPQKTQLEYAVRLSLKKLNVPVRLPRRGLFGTLKK